MRGVDVAQVKGYDTPSGSLTTPTTVEPGQSYWVQVASASTFSPSLPKDPTTRFVYDGDGGRVQQITAAGTTTFLGALEELAPDGTRTKYVFAGSQRIAAITRTPQQQAALASPKPWWQRAWTSLLAFLDVPTAEAAELASSIRFFHGDHLGSTNLVIDGNGAVVERTEHTPFGSVHRHEGATTSPHQFTGQRFDNSTGLYFYHARYYDPELGRFTQPDPFVQDPSDPQTLNRYAYCRNNPINLVDPTGFGWKSFFKAVLGIALGVVIGVATAGLGAPIAVAVAAGAFVGTTSAAAFNGVPLGQSLALGAVSGLTGGLGAHFAIGAGIVKGALIGASLGAAGGAASNAIVGANPVRGALAGGVGGLLLGGAGGAWNSGLSGSQQTLLGLGASTAAGAASSALIEVCINNGHH